MSDEALEMKIPFSNLFRFFSVLFLGVWSAAPLASAQTRPSLAVQLSAGQPALSLKGDIGTVYSIQCATDLSPTNHWTDRTILQVQGDNTVWNDPSASTSQRFYRALRVVPPAATNLAFIQPGTFTMGSPTSEASRDSDEVQHVVTISRGFWMGKYLVTQGEYLAVVGSNPSYFNGFRSPTDYGTDLSRPVEFVTWLDATNYCVLRTQHEQTAGLIPTNCVYRLPTESEWEYACRAGTTTAFYLGSGLHSGQANFDGQVEYDAALGDFDNPNGIWLQQTSPVGSYAKNAWGLYDMIGNVFEWCQDWYGTYPGVSVTDPQGAVMGSGRVFRGGAWIAHAQNCRSAQRRYVTPSVTGYYFGFRVVLALSQ